MPDPSDAANLNAFCLCAAWCSACRDWRPAFDRLAAAAGPGVRWLWVDIEDEDETVGDLDIENFPTLLIARGGQPLYYGPVVPQEAAVATLVQRALEGRLDIIRGGDAPALVQRLQRRPVGG